MSAVAIFEGLDDGWIDTGATRWFDGENVLWPPVKPKNRRALKRYIEDPNQVPTHEWKSYKAKIRGTYGCIIFKITFSLTGVHCFCFLGTFKEAEDKIQTAVDFSDIATDIEPSTDDRKRKSKQTEFFNPATLEKPKKKLNRPADNNFAFDNERHESGASPRPPSPPVELDSDSENAGMLPTCTLITQTGGKFIE